MTMEANTGTHSEQFKPETSLRMSSPQSINSKHVVRSPQSHLRSDGVAYGIDRQPRARNDPQPRQKRASGPGKRGPKGTENHVRILTPVLFNFMSTWPCHVQWV
jgi:hypothetical protein